VGSCVCHPQTVLGKAVSPVKVGRYAAARSGNEQCRWEPARSPVVNCVATTCPFNAQRQRLLATGVSPPPGNSATVRTRQTTGGEPRLQQGMRVVCGGRESNASAKSHAHAASVFSNVCWSAHTFSSVRCPRAPVQTPARGRHVVPAHQQVV